MSTTNLSRVLLIGLLAIAIWQCVTLAISAGITRSVSFSVNNSEVTPAAAKLAARRLETVSSLSSDYIPALYLIEQLTPDVGTSVALIEQVTELQPREPRAWARLFQLQLEQGRRGETISATLDAVEKFGRWEPVSNWLIVDGGTRYWLSLDSQQREAVLRAGARSLIGNASFKKPETVELLKQRGFLPAACSLLTNEQRETIRDCR